MLEQRGKLTQTRILEQIGQLPIQDRLDIIEGTLRLIRQDLRRTGKPRREQARKVQLAAAARALLPDYAAGGELTAFTALDREDFHAEG